MDNKIIPWQQSLAEAFSNIEDLCKHLQIEPASLPLLPNLKAFPLRVPRCFVDCMEPGNPYDPLLRQVLPFKDELRDYPGYSSIRSEICRLSLQQVSSINITAGYY